MPRIPRVWLPVCLAIFAAGVLGAEEGGAYKDDFSTYEAGSDGEPTWNSGGIDWTVQDGRWVCTDPGKDTAVLTKFPPCRRVTVEADLELKEATGREWKVAGLCIQQDHGNFWHLALVEAPDANEKRHFVELAEMYKGGWLAQTQGDTKLVPTSAEGTSFNWAYNTVYRMKLELTPEGITGQVLDRAGKVCAKIGFAFGDKPAVKTGKVALTSGGFSSAFDNLNAEVRESVADAAEKKAGFPAYSAQGFDGVKGKATGFFHVEQIDGKWWAIDPNGKGFFFVGTDHANYRVHWCEKLGYAPYHKNCEKLYGSEEKWADSTLARLKAWGFNSLGANPSPSLMRRGLPHPEFVSIGTDFAAIDPITPKTTWTGFPNVFSPRFRKFCEKRAQQRCAPLKDDPWLIGYFIDNELEWHAWTGGGPFDDSFKKPADHSAKIALVGLFKERHGTIEKFNAAWGTRLASFDELLKSQDVPKPLGEAAREDMQAFIRLCAEQYFSIASAAIRKYDPNHMVMGCRFAGQIPEIADIAGKYSDVMTVNCYRTVDLETGKMADGFEEDLAKWYAACKRPMIVTEWSFPALDVGLPCKHGAGQRVLTQKERTFAFTVFQKLLFTTEFMVGSNFFMWADEPALGISSTFPEDSNYGLVNEQDVPYELLTRRAAELNPLVYALHGGNVPDVAVRAGEKAGTFELENRGKAPASGTLTLWIDGHPKDETLKIEPSAKIARFPEGAGKPGAQFAVASFEAENALLERDTTDNTASFLRYVPGLPWTVEGAMRRVPICVANPKSEVLDGVVAVLPLTEGPLAGLSREDVRFAVVDAVTGMPAPCQVDRLEGGAELAIRIASLPARAARTFLVYLDVQSPAASASGVECRAEGTLFAANAGALTLTRAQAESGTIVERIAMGETEMGSFKALVCQDIGQRQWIDANKVEKVDVFNGPARCVLEVTAARTIDDPKARERAYRAKYRLTVMPGRASFGTKLIWLENSDTREWKCESYYHYLNSRIGGNAADDDSRTTYWMDGPTKRCLGLIAGTGKMGIQFWKDPGGGQHPDAWVKVDRVLKPGERVAGEQPSAHVVAASEDEWAAIHRRLKAEREVMVEAWAAESR